MPVHENSSKPFCFGAKCKFDLNEEALFDGCFVRKNFFGKAWRRRARDQAAAV